VITVPGYQRSADELVVYRDREASVLVLEYAVHGRAVRRSTCAVPRGTSELEGWEIQPSSRPPKQSLHDVNVDRLANSAICLSVRTLQNPNPEISVGEPVRVVRSKRPRPSARCRSGKRCPAASIPTRPSPSAKSPPCFRIRATSPALVRASSAGWRSRKGRAAPSIPIRRPALRTSPPCFGVWETSTVRVR
jgi:hypothetical protein